MIGLSGQTATRNLASDSYNLPVSKDKRSLLALTIVCTFAAIIFGFGANVFAFKAAFKGTGTEQLIVLTNLVVIVALAGILVFRGGWWGVVAAIFMVTGATFVEWALFPLAFDWAALANPAAYQEKLGNIGRPSYFRFGAIFDIMLVGGVAALAQGLRMMAHVDPTRTPDE
ncbi:hypothetical protein BH18ACT10_BH18ACT10_07960 [soil metagenome]|nr:hypothetical protein [Rubrobacter sp.]